MSALLDDPKVLDQMQDEVVGMFKAWVDRGLKPEEAAQVLLANANLVMIKIGAPLGEIVKLAVHQWEHNDGRI